MYLVLTTARGAFHPGNIFKFRFFTKKDNCTNLEVYSLILHLLKHVLAA
jgi:hypothetical protein